MINEHLIQWRGKAVIDRPLQYDKDYHIEATVSVSGLRETPLGDGNKDVTYLVEPVMVTMVNEGGDRIEFKKKSTMSQALRFQIIMWMRDNAGEVDLDDDVAYETFMKKLLDNFSAIAPLIMKEE